MLPPALLGLTAMIFAHATAIPLLQVRQDGACTVLIGSCNDQNIELDLTECACACLQNSCELVHGPCASPSLRTIRANALYRLGVAITRRGLRSRGTYWAVPSRIA